MPRLASIILLPWSTQPMVVDSDTVLTVEEAEDSAVVVEAFEEGVVVSLEGLMLWE